MEAAKPRLGRGLDSLLSSVAQPDGQQTLRPAMLAVDLIQPNPYQPRKRFDEDELQSLTESIRVHGVLQPLLVRPQGASFLLIAGERRLKAARSAGLTEVPVHFVEFNDQQVFEAALVENIQRSDLNPIEKALGFKDYIDRYNVTHEQLGQKLGLDRSTIANLVGLLHLAPEVQDALRMGQISLGHAKVLKGLTHDRQVSLCKETILKGYSVAALELAVKAAKAETAEAEGPAKAPVEKTAHVCSLENELRQKLACRVEIKVKAKDKGQIVLAFNSNDDFERIVEALRKV